MKALSIIGIILCAFWMGITFPYLMKGPPAFKLIGLLFPLFFLALSIVGVVTGTRYNRLKRNNNSNQE